MKMELNEVQKQDDQAKKEKIFNWLVSQFKNLTQNHIDDYLDRVKQFHGMYLSFLHDIIMQSDRIDKFIELIDKEDNAEVIQPSNVDEIKSLYI